MRTVTASPPNGGSGYEKPQSGLRPFVRFFSATFFCLRETASQFPNRKQKNVSYRQTLHENFFTPNSSSLRAILGAGILLKE